MKKNKYGVLILALLIIFTQVTNVYAAGKIDTETSAQTETGYIIGPFATEEGLPKLKMRTAGVYQSSAKEADSWNQVKRILYEGMRNREEYIEIDYTGDSASIENFYKAIQEVLNEDHYIWYNYAGCYYGMRYKTGKVQFYIQAHYWTSKQQEEYVTNRVNEILSQIIFPGMSDIEKVEAVHDYVILNVEYDLSFSRYTAYDALYHGSAVCQGYALLGHRMLNEIGIPTRIIASRGMNHAWNLVKLDGKWYHLDMTWDDPIPDVKGRVLYHYFLLTDDEIKQRSHHWAPEEYPTSGEGFILIPVTGITINEGKTITLSKRGEKKQLTTTILPHNATNKNVRWSSSNKSVVSVDKNGVITAMENGSATITVTTEDGNHSASCQVVVAEPKIITITAIAGENGSITPGTLQVKEGSNITFKITPDEGYIIVDVKVNGKSVGAVSQYTLKNITENCKIEAYFALEIKDSIFKDIPLNHWAYKQIESLVNRKIINGYRDGSFRPGDYITRAQAAVMIVNAIGLDYKGKVPSFSDVPSDHWAAQYIAVAEEAGIINGYRDGTFKPGDNITRAQIAVMVSKAFDLTNTGPEKNFNDVPKSHWARKYVETLAGNGVISGYRDNTFRPGELTTRAHFSVILTNALNK
ncbi:MAG: S-layer homology domain-containing protein [Caldicoprobacterales bacterium]|jgi:uncharacterized protein YjdB